VLAVGGIAFVVGAGIGAGRSSLMGEARVVFTHVRLLPCLIKESVAHHAAPIAGALTGSGPAGPQLAAAAPVAAPVVAAQGAVADASAVDPGDIVDSGRFGLFRGLGASFGEGFDAALDGNREIADAVGDSRLMIQIGLALGFLYAAFLSVWFWATRLRPRPRD